MPVPFEMMLKLNFYNLNHHKTCFQTQICISSFLPMFEQHAQMKKKKFFFDESKEPAKNLALQSRFRSFNPQILLIIINS